MNFLFCLVLLLFLISAFPLSPDLIQPDSAVFVFSLKKTTNTLFLLFRTPSSWDPHDDQMLRHLKEDQKLGWKEIAAHFPYRTTNACQFRWRRLMSGNLKSAQPQQMVPKTQSAVAPPMPLNGRSASHQEWTPHEDELIRTRSDLSIQELSLLLPQRSEAEINDRCTRLWNYSRQQQQQYQHHFNQHSIPYQQQQQLDSNYTTAPAKRPLLVGRPTNHKSAFDGLRLPLPVSQKQNTNPYLLTDQH